MHREEREQSFNRCRGGGKHGLSKAAQNPELRSFCSVFGVEAERVEGSATPSLPSAYEPDGERIE